MSVVKGEKTSFVDGIKKQYRGVTAELKKVHWPTRKEITAYTLVVLTAVFIVGLGIFFVDSAVGYIIDLLITRKF
jgi:preprotein translocase subunit SecE